MAYLIVANDRSISRQRVFRDRTNPIDVFNDRELLSRYRVDRQSLCELVDLTENLLERKTNRNFAVSPVLQVCTALRFYATGAFQSVIGDIHGLSKPTVSRIIRSVTEAIVKVNTFPLSITFPREAHQINLAKASFYELAGFPNVIGCIDGTQIAIKAPSINEPNYVCRKNFHSLNVQATTDAELRVTSLVAKFPGSAHDSFILQQSSLWDGFERGRFEGYMLGDSGYPLKRWLLTPFQVPTTPAQHNYNKSHKTTRCSIERAFGVAKSRFRCIHHKSGGCLMYNPSLCAQIIVAVFKLNNFCINKNLPQPAIIADDETDEGGVIEDINQDGNQTRDTLVAIRFS